MFKEAIIIAATLFFLATLTPLLFTKKKLARTAGLIMLFLASLTTAIFSFYSFWNSIPVDYFIKVDRLSAFFMFVISLVSATVSLYSISYVDHINGEKRKNILVALMSVFILSMILVVSTDNLIQFILFWELMAISSFFLVMTDFEKKETVKSGIFYFVMTQLSTLFVIAGVIAMHVHSGDGTFSTVVLPASLKAVVFLLLFTGFSIKAGLIPFHKWLPYAHSAAPSNISALMSGVMIKVAIYAMIRFLLQIMAPDSWWGVLILIIATISTFLGVIYALKEHDIKRLLAYHSIENIGIIMMGVGLYIIFMHQGVEQLAMLALYGGVFHVLNHALFKSLLFLSAGSVVNATGTRNIEDMGGLIKYMPYTATMFLIGSIAISALPPLNGFVSELMIFESLLQAGFHNINVVISILLFASLSLLALTSALAAACFVKAFGTTFLAVPRTNIKPKEATKLTIFSQAILALAIIILGVFSYQIFAALGVDVPIPNLMYVGIILALLIAATAIVFWTRKVRVAETWGCGIISQNGKMEYTASGFSEPIVTIFKSIFRTKKERNIEYHDSKKAIVKTGHAEINLFKFFEELIYMPIAKAVKRVSVWFSDMQNSIEPDLYILQAFATIAILLAIIWWII